MDYLANVPGIEQVLAIKVLMPDWQGDGGFGQMHYLANVAGIKQILAIKVLMPGWQGDRVFWVNALFGYCCRD